MKYLNQSILIITITTVLICNCVLAQTNQIATAQDGRKVILKSDGTWEYQNASQNTSQSAMTFDNKPFDVKQEKLPPNYKGQDAEKIFNSLFKILLYKDNTEPLADFRARMQKDKQNLVTEYKKEMSDLSLDGIFAFQAVVIPSYDNNSKIMKPRFIAETSWFNEKLGYTYSSNDKQVRSFVGQNAYGAQVNVRVVESESLQILAINGEKFLSSESTGTLKYIGTGFNLETDSTQVKNNLRALIICKLIEPYGRYREEIIEPTFTNPEQTELKAKALVTEILEIWYYDSATGKIYFKQKAK